MRPKISVIIPVFKTEKVIGRCLESVLSQTLQDFEVVIVNDCTPDGAMDIVKKYSNNDIRFKLVEHPQNMGLMYARRTGYQNASGQYFLFLDSDDSLPTDALEILYDAIENSGSDITMSGFRYVYTDKQCWKDIYPDVVGEYTPDKIFHFLLIGTLRHNLAFCIFNSDLFSNEYYTIPNQTNGEDLILFYQLVANSKKINIINAITYNYFQDGVSSTRCTPNINQICQLAKVHNFKYSFLRKQGISNRIIIDNIIPKVARWYSVKNTSIALQKLDDVVRKQITLVSTLRVLKLKDRCRYIFYRVIRTINP